MDNGSGSKRALVAGATGYLGGYVVREFKRQGYWVRALVRDPKKLPAELRAAIDDVYAGEVTRPETLDKACDGIDVVFSSVGITKQKGKQTFRDVDYQGNKNLLDVARKAGVKKFIYVSVFNGQRLLHLDIVKAHEDFVRELEASGLDYAVIRPTGYFSDMGEFFKMAQGGRVFLFGNGENHINPIHGADLAKVCVDAVAGQQKEIDVGGPKVLSYREIAAEAFAVLGKPVKISTMPAWLIRALVAIVRVFSRKTGEVLAFLSTMMLSEVVAPQAGTHTLKEHFETLAAGSRTLPAKQG